MHMGFRDVFDHDRYIIIPSPDGFVVRRSDKPTIFVHKRDRVYRSQVLVIFLRDLARIHIILGTTCQHPLRDIELDTRHT